MVVPKRAKLLDGCDRGGTALQGWNKLIASALSGDSRSELAAWGSAPLGLRFRLCCASPEPQLIGAGIKPPSLEAEPQLVPSLGGFGNLGDTYRVTGCGLVY